MKRISSTWILVALVSLFGVPMPKSAQALTPLQIDCPPDLEVSACDSNGVAVIYPAPTVRGGECRTDPMVTCSPASGSLFKVGKTTVTCIVTNDCGQRASCNFSVSVVLDNTPPEITCPSNVVRSVRGADGLVIEYPPPKATDALDPAPVITCTPTSGSLFPIGTTLVECSAVDSCGNRSTCTFSVTVEALPNPEVWAFGLLHQSLGAAQVDVDAERRLTVANIGSSGQDGVRVELGDSDGLHWRLPFPEGLPEGATFTTRSQTLNSMDQEVLGAQATVASRQGDLVLRPDVSPSGATTFKIKLYRDGVMVHEQSGLDNLQAIVIPGVAAGVTWEECHHCVQGVCVTSYHWALATPVEPGGIPDPGPIMADTLAVEPENPTVAFGKIRAVELRAFNPDPNPWRILIAREWLMMFGDPPTEAQPHLALGQARFDARAGKLVVSNIGSSGQDGIEIDFDALGLIFGLPPVHGYEVALEPLAIQKSDTFSVSAWGVFAGEPETDLGAAGLRWSGEDLEVFADFSSIGASSVLVEVYQGESRVGSVSSPGGGTLGTLTAGPEGLPLVSGCGKLPPWPLPCYILNLDRPAEFNVPGAAPLTGDQLRILAENAAGQIDQLSSMRLTAMGIQSMVLRGGNLIENRVTVQTIHGVLILTWEGPGTLQEADQVTGPFREIMNATSPHQVRPMEDQRFYRVWRAP